MKYKVNLPRGKTMNTTSIKLTDLSKVYGKYEAVKNLQLEVPRGELFGFLGPNGAGKTSTIKMMTGLLEPTKGTVKVAGINIWQDPLEAKSGLPMYRISRICIRN